MSEYEFDKNRTATGGHANPDGSNDPDQSLAPTTDQSRSAASGTPGEWAEQDEWSLRSSSVDDDDPLIKLARLMQENERNFEAAAAAAPADVPPAPVEDPATPQPTGAPPQQMETVAPVPPGAGAAAAAPIYAYDDDSDWDAPAETYENAPAPTLPPVAEQVTPAAAVQAPQQIHAGAPQSAAALEPAMALANTAPGHVSEAQPAELVQDAPAAGQDVVENATSVPVEADPFVPAKARNAPIATDYDDFDVSRMPRAIRPPENSVEDNLGGLHGRATEDLIAAANQLRQKQTDLTPPVEQAPAVVAPTTTPVESLAAEPTAAPAATATPADPLAAELTRYANNEPPAVSAVPEAQPQQTAPASQPDLLAASQVTPQQQDFSYLREVEDLRVPPKDGDPASARLQAVQADATAVDTTPPEAVPVEAPAETTGEEYADYEDNEAGLFANRGMLVATGVLAFVILGAVGLMTYQALFGETTDGPAPLVMADKSDVRITPDGQGADETNSGLGSLTETGSPQDSQIVSRAEQPLNLNPNIDPNRSVRIIPSGSQNNSQNDGGLGPRPVQTFTVRPDGSIVNNSGNDASTQTALVQPRSVTTQPITSNNGVTQVTTDNTVATLPRPRPGRTLGATAQPTATVNDVVAQTQLTGRAALPDSPTVSVAPRTTQGPTFDPAAPAVQPSVNTVITQAEPQPSTAITPIVADPAPNTNTASSNASGDFVVQISSQRTEGAATSTFADLQSRFPSVLGGQQPDIVRADLGARGIFYRVRVGPMQTRDEAGQFCQRLQAAGGDCIVARR